MNPQERFRRVETLFRAASALPADDREVYLLQQCAGETSMLVQLRSLLQADEQQAGILDRPALVPVTSMLAGPPVPHPPTPEQIGRFRVIRRIGDGGMGSVFEAEQENPRRRVAVKLLRPVADSPRLLRRFQQEGQILGRLQHPGIAQILQAGTTSEDSNACPYIAMELVQGPSLLEYTRSRRVRFRQRLELFALICDAVHYAHQRGVVHRDLKPANILVAGENDAVQSKILDFGVARLTDPELEALTQHTNIGELIGTVAYMSPEQAAGDPSQVDWRSDVYSLGVILYELLTERLPHDVRRLMVHEAVRMIREDDPTPAGSVDRTLRGDVETILAKALEKDKARRYQSAAELSSDIRRYLHLQPISARSASALYRIRKFARRNKTVVTGVAVAFLSLAVGAGVAVREAIVAEHARAEEHRLRGDAEHQTYRACLVAASSALRYHEVADARRHLEAAPAGMRGWEWEHLSSRVDDSLAVLQTSFEPLRLAHSPDGRVVVSCASSGDVHAWRAPDLAPLAGFSVFEVLRERRVQQFVFSPDSRELRVDTRAGSVTLCSESLQMLGSDQDRAAHRSRDGRWGVFAEQDQKRHEMVLREMAGRREILRIEGADAYEVQVQFSDNSRLLALGLPDDRGLLLYQVEEGRQVAARPDLSAASALAFSGDARRLAAATATGTGVGYVLDTANGRDIAVLMGHRSTISAMDFSPDGHLIATASSDRTLRLWRAADGAPISVMHGNQGSVVEMAFSPDGATVVTACTDRAIRWWDARATTDPFVLQTPASVYGLSFSPDGKALAAACLGGERPLRIWDLETSRESHAALDGYLSTLSYSPDGSKLAVGRSHGSTQVVSTANMSVETVYPGHHWRTDWLAFDPAGGQLLSLGNGSWLTAHRLADGSRLRVRVFPAKSTGEGCRAVVSPDGASIVVASGTGIHILDARTWNELGVLQGHSDDVYALGFSPDAARLVSGSRDRTLRVWDVARRVSIATLTGHSDEIFAVAFSPDGKRIVSGGRDSVIRVWDAEQFDEITQLHGHSTFVYCLAFSPDGHLLASGGGDNTVRLWDTRPYRDRRPH